ncbi:MAG TPA: ankyrin repeat domain-containing protein, partial [Thermoanaerobaculia bacterium]|nr:ankyrin repeat domain-containing protein [Thermoanaerobaculia bacterium]
MPVARSPGAIRLAVLTAAVLMAAAPAVRAGPQENAALFQAVKEGRLDAIRDLLRRGADANARNESGVTPLIMAAIVGGEPAARELLRAGADPNVQDHHEGTALGFAVGKESGPLVQALIEGGA